MQLSGAIGTTKCNFRACSDKRNATFGRAQHDEMQLWGACSERRIKTFWRVPADKMLLSGPLRATLGALGTTKCDFGVRLEQRNATFGHARNYEMLLSGALRARSGRRNKTFWPAQSNEIQRLTRSGPQNDTFWHARGDFLARSAQLSEALGAMKCACGPTFGRVLLSSALGATQINFLTSSERLSGAPGRLPGEI